MKTDYEVKKGPFIIKLVICVIFMLAVISLVVTIPESIKDSVYYSGDEYHLSNMEYDRNRRRIESIYNELTLYHLTDEKYDEYWELVDGYEDYVLYVNYKKVADAGYTIEGAENKEEFYSNMVISNAANVKYEGNARQLRELADRVHSQEVKDLGDNDL